jgi:hypothetical protein
MKDYDFLRVRVYFLGTSTKDGPSCMKFCGEGFMP